MSLFPSSSTRLVRDLLLRAPVLSHLASDKVRTRLPPEADQPRAEPSSGSRLQEFSGKGVISRPGNLPRPRKLSVPRRVQGLGSQIQWLSLSGGQPQCGSRRGRSSNHSTGELSMSLRDGTGAESNLLD